MRESSGRRGSASPARPLSVGAAAIGQVATLDLPAQALVGLGQLLERTAQFRQALDAQRRERAGFRQAERLLYPLGAGQGGGYRHALEDGRVGMAERLAQHLAIGGGGGGMRGNVGEWRKR